MLEKSDPQGNFFDSYIEEHYLPREHEFLKIKEKIDFSFIEEKTEDLYSKEVGRTSYPPCVIFKILFFHSSLKKYLTETIKKYIEDQKRK